MNRSQDTNNLKHYLTMSMHACIGFILQFDIHEYMNTQPLNLNHGMSLRLPKICSAKITITTIMSYKHNSIEQRGLAKYICVRSEQ